MSLLDKERHPRHTDAYSRNLDRFACVRKRKLAIQRTVGDGDGKQRALGIKGEIMAVGVIGVCETCAVP